MKKILIAVLVLIPIMWVADASAQSVGSAAPNFTLDRLNGGTFTLSDYEGKVVFIFFFGYGCPHCLANGPNTQSGIYELYQGESDFVAIGIDTWDGNSAGVQNFQSSTGVQYPLCLKGSSVEDLYQTTYDRIVVIDKAGIIKFKATSDATSSVVTQAASVIDQLLGEDPPPMEEPPMEEPPMDSMVTGLGELSSDQIGSLVFPNPVRNYLFINGELLPSGDYDFDLFNVKGQRIFQIQLQRQSDDPIQVTFPFIRDGLYIMRLSSSDGMIIKKILVRQ